MTAKSKKHATDIPESGSALRKLFELAVGPGLMLAVLIALGAHLIVNGEISEGAFFTVLTEGR